MRYAPIEDHGVIGDMHTVALVATDGTIDWFCPPRFDAPSVFGSILDADKGGRFQIAPVNGGGNVKQLYLPDTNVLITRFLTAHGVGEVQDFMPIHEDVEQPQRIVRRVMSVRGAMTFKLDCSPAFDYARTAHRAQRRADRRRVRHADADAVAVVAGGAHRRSRAASRPTFELAAGRDAHVRARDRARRHAGRAHRNDEESQLAVRRDGRVLAQLAVELHLPRPLARDGAALGAGAEAAHLRAHRRDHRRAHREPARGHRRRPQLGLPLHLDPRLGVHALRVPAPRVLARGRGVHALPQRPRARVRGRVGRRRCRSCTASTAGTTSRRSSSTTSRATAGRGRCASATAPPTSCSSTSTAS